MKKMMAVVSLGLAFAAGAAFADKVQDWQDLDNVRTHVQQAINEMERARSANHYDMDGHGAKAEQHLHEAEHELQLAIESAKKSKK